MSFRGNVSAVFGGLGSELGKKGTVSDVTIYNSKAGEAVLSFVEATGYPDKVQSLVSAVNMSDQAVVRVESLNASLAETVVALDAMGMGRGYIVFAGDVSPESLKPLLAGTVVDSYAPIENQPMAIKEKLAELNPPSEGAAIVQVDHSFQVKGVGTVALGVVKAGAVRRHDQMAAEPVGGKVLVKSIQVHDTDVEEACCGVRVGLALKDVSPEDVPRGTVLSTAGNVRSVAALEAEAVLSKYSPKGLYPGDQILVNSCLNYSPARVEEGSVRQGASGRVKLAFERPLPALGGRMHLMDPGLKMPRVFGHVKV